MTCQPCVEKWFQRYKARNLDDATARMMAEKLMKRVEERRTRERAPRPTRPINEEASKFWNRKIYMGYNPAYAQDCNVTCVGKCMKGWFCTESIHCLYCAIVGWSCPDALPHSHFTGSEDCACVDDAAGSDCHCTGAHECTGTGTAKCLKSGTCEYDCDEGYYWTGVECAEISGYTRRKGDGLIWYDE